VDCQFESPDVNKMKKFKKFSLEKSSAANQPPDAENVTAKIHAALWPKNNFELFAQLLELHPEDKNVKFGLCRDSLLHR
jgi:hypothetical protein